MNKWIFPCNIKKYNVDGAFNKFDELEWSQGRTKVEIGDLVFIYVAAPVQSIKYLCEVMEKDIPVDKCSLNDGEFSLTGSPHVSNSLLYMRIRLLERYQEDVISMRIMEKCGVKGRIQGPRKLPVELEQYIDAISGNDVSFDEDLLPEEIKEIPGKPITEGAKKIITVNSYERDPKAKKVCKDYYIKRDGRIVCQICGFDFGKTYGTQYSNMIHIHHIIPISEIGDEYEVDPINDLIPVCPNCHMVLHAGQGMTIKELQEKIKKHYDNNRTR